MSELLLSFVSKFALQWAISRAITYIWHLSTSCNTEEDETLKHTTEVHERQFEVLMHLLCKLEKENEKTSSIGDLDSWSLLGDDPRDEHFIVNKVNH